MQSRGRLWFTTADALVLFALFCLVAPASTFAGEGASTAPASLSLSASGSTLGTLAMELAKLPVRELSLVVVGPPVVAAPQSSGVSLSVREQLRTEIVERVAAAIPYAKTLPEAKSIAQGRRSARSSRLPLIYIAPTIAFGELQLEVTVTHFAPTFWGRVLTPEGTIASRGMYRVAADASVRRLFPKGGEILQNKATYRSPLSSPLAIACGDFDRDGRSDVIVLGRSEIVLGTIDEGGFAVASRRSWNELSPVSSTPLRAALGAIAFTERGFLVGLSDRAAAIELDRHLAEIGRLPRAYPLSDQQCAPFTTTGVSRQWALCGPRSPNTSRSAFIDSKLEETPGLDAFAVGTLTLPSGLVTTYTVELKMGSTVATVQVQQATQPTTVHSVNDAGSAVAWADLDGDETMELLSSRASPRAEEDELRVHTLGKSGIQLRKTIKAGPIHAVAVCPFVAENTLQVVAAVGEEIWLLK